MDALILTSGCLGAAGYAKRLRHGEIASENPWNATTLEWACPSPPPHGNFTKEIVVHRGPYEYSVPGHPTDFTPQNAPEPKAAK